MIINELLNRFRLAIEYSGSHFKCNSKGNPHHYEPDRKIINANNQLPPDDFTNFIKKKLCLRVGRWKSKLLFFLLHSTEDTSGRERGSEYFEGDLKFSGATFSSFCELCNMNTK
jgi:hypothetical protein